MASTRIVMMKTIQAGEPNDENERELLPPCLPNVFLVLHSAEPLEENEQYPPS